MVAGLPPWLRWRAGGGALLLVAPHGGVSERDLLEPPPRPTRTNDLFTDGLAEDLASALDASLVANLALDRNELDLNRISEVEERATWFLELLAALLERILARHGVAEVVFVHGWHIVQPKCDIGVGARLDARGAVQPDRHHRLTVDTGYVGERLELLRGALARRDIATAYGERWPAAHRDNVMQLFRRAGPPRVGRAGRLLEVARAGRVHAVQLELGAPLRWPGAVRQAFAQAFVESFADTASGGRARGAVQVESARSRPPAGGGGDGATAAARGAAGHSARSRPAAPGRSRAASPVRAVHLQAFDARAGLGVVAGLGSMPDGRLGARLLLLSGDRCLTMFTGEEESAARGAVGGLALRRTARGVALEFAGPALAIPDAARHFRFEPAQRDARVVPVSVRLELALAAGESYGPLAGEVVVDGERAAIESGGFADAAIGRPPPAAAPATRLLAGFGAEVGVAVELREGAPGAIARLGGVRAGEVVPAALEVPEWSLEAGDGSIALRPRGAAALVCRPRSRVTLLRPLDAGRYLRIAFGVAEFEWAGLGSGSGFYEHATVHAAPRTGADGT